MSNIETKTVDFKVKGKDGLVQAIKIQKHKPSAPMCFIRTVTGHMLFCQEDHPVCIRSIDGQDTVVEAKDVVMFHDRIWVDNTDLKIPVCKDLNKDRGDDYENFYITLEKIFNPNTTVPNELDLEYFVGDDLTNLYFNLDKLNMNNSNYLELLIRFTVPRNNGTPYFIKSFNLVSQLKLIADHLKCECVIDLISDTSWCIKYLNLKKEDEFKVRYKEYVDVEQVISGIENYQGYVYDLKTETEEFMNNNVQTHNSFHCFVKESTLFVKTSDNNISVKSFKQIWDEYETPIYEKPYTNGMIQYEKDLSNNNLFVYDKDGEFTKVLKVIRHKKEESEDIRYICLSSGEAILTQGNHPHMIRYKDSNEYMMCEAKDISHHDAELKYFKTISDYKSLLIDNLDEESDINLIDIIKNLDSYETNENIKIYKNINDNKKILYGLILNKNLYHISFANNYKFIYDCKNSDHKLYGKIYHNDPTTLFTFYYILKIFDIECMLDWYGQSDNSVSFEISKELFTEATGENPDDYCKNYTMDALLRGDDTNLNTACISMDLEKLESDSNLTFVQTIRDDYLYDLTTESSTLTVNGIWTHNTGGAVEFKKIDILKELGLNIDSNEETHLKRLFNQVENDLFCNNALTKIVINKSLFQDEYAIKKDGDVYKLPLGYFVLSTGELRIDATIEQPIELSIPTDYSETSSTIELIYGQGAKILHIKSFSIAPEKIAQHLDSLVGGKSPYTSPESLLRKFHNDLAGFNNYDMTHLEVIVASVLRNKLDPMIPARLKEPYNPETFSIKALPGVISWSLGMAYENISKALSTGLISDDTKNLSQIEKVLYGEPLSELSHELLAEKRKKR